MDHKEIALLVEKAKENDKSAMGKLYNETHKKAYFVALKMTKNEDDAMDILQDSFVKAFKKIDTLENPEQFQSWLNQIVANKCRDYLKKKKEIFFSETEDEDGNSIEDTFEEENISLIPDKSLDTAETKRLVMNIIEGLSEDQKLCVLMYYYENMSVGDIAEALECSTGTVKSRLNYARQKIKTEVENLEKTQGIKLYGIAPVPFVVWVLMRMSESTVVPRDIAPLVIESAVGTAGAAGAATAAGGTAGAAAGGAAGATGATAITGKTIALISAGVIAVGGIGVAVATNSNTYMGYVYEYNEEWDGIVITDYNGNEADLVIPNEINGQEVVGIEEAAFEECDVIKTVVLPDTLQFMGYNSFSNCDNLKELTFNSDLDSYYWAAIYDCDNLEIINCYYNERRIPLLCSDCDNLNTIYSECGRSIAIKAEDGNLYGNTANVQDLTHLRYGEGIYLYMAKSDFDNSSSMLEVDTIGIASFVNNKNITTITIPDGVKLIDNGAFAGCVNLSEINIPESVVRINYDAFRGTPWFENQPGDMIIVNDILVRYRGNESVVVIPDNITSIADGAFEDCTSVTEIIIPDNVDHIGYSAFENCTNLVEINIPDGVREINFYTFKNCTNLKEITIPDHVYKILSDAFENCTNLSKINIPDSTNRIDYGVFKDCPNIVATYKGKTYTYEEIEDLYNDINNQ